MEIHFYLLYMYSPLSIIGSFVALSQTEMSVSSQSGPVLLQENSQLVSQECGRLQWLSLCHVKLGQVPSDKTSRPDSTYMLVGADGHLRQVLKITKE